MDIALIKKYFEQAELTITTEQAEKLCTFANLLKEYNEKFNLTAIIDDEGIIKKHFIDSLAGLKYLPDKGRIVDLGSGAGFPAIPIKIFRPQQEILCVDSVNKKVDFINLAVEKLGLTNISATHSRIEDLASGKQRESFDIAIARAVSPLPTLLEYAVPLLKVNGVFLAYKSEKADEEVASAQNALHILNAEVKKIEKIMLLEEFSRCFILIKKTGKTSFKYPRNQNKPRNLPL